MGKFRMMQSLRLAPDDTTSPPSDPSSPGEIAFVVETAPEGGLTARALGHSIFTEAETLDALRANVREAVDCHFDDGKKPGSIRLLVVTEEVIAA
jgi:hypothetical protein